MNNISTHCRELDRCNQRGGRMMTIFDLLEADSLPLDLAAYLAWRIWNGASFLTGAIPGGAGKTTVMCALLNFVAPTRSLIPATPETIRNADRDDDETRDVYICHEIGMGPYFAYLWGRELRTYCSLSDFGHQLATNLHADDLDDAKAQICGDNHVPERHFNAFNMLIFLRISGRYAGRRHWIEKVYESNGHEPHRLIYTPSAGLCVPGKPETEPWRLFLERELARGLHSIEDVRSAVLRESLQRS